MKGNFFDYLKNNMILFLYYKHNSNWDYVKSFVAGEHPAAMQHGEHGAGRRATQSAVLVTVALLVHAALSCR